MSDFVFPPFADRVQAVADWSGVRVSVFYGPGASFAPQELTDLLQLEEELMPLVAEVWHEFAEPERSEESVGLLTSVTASTVDDWRGWTQAVLVWGGSGMFAPGAGGGVVRVVEAPMDATAMTSRRADAATADSSAVHDG
ncbi:hypothetical protein [Nocardia sp. NPDC051570]|uniref:hypothetical protein n=1 Tax=Nocardia sp. NPDC051570 TaxID=3364324 RepID=UPI00379743F9